MSSRPSQFFTSGGDGCEGSGSEGSGSEGLGGGGEGGGGEGLGGGGEGDGGEGLGGCVGGEVGAPDCAKLVGRGMACVHAFILEEAREGDDRDVANCGLGGAYSLQLKGGLF